MSIHPLIKVLTIFLMAGVLTAQDSTSVFESPSNGNPLMNYIQELDEMGRVLSGWGHKDSLNDSWFFASHAMLILRTNGDSDNKPFPGLASTIPALWSDLKYLTPNKLIELAGGALSSTDLMTLSTDCDLKKIQVEERFIMHVAGLSHLRMLQGTIGDSLYQQVIQTTMSKAVLVNQIPQTLINAIETLCDERLARRFAMVLEGHQWVDVELEHERVGGDSIRFNVTYNNDLVFPCQLRVISSAGDSSYYESDRMTEGLVFAQKDIREAQLDPGHILSEYYRYNNHWPVLKGSLRVQPFFALPDWEKYRVVVSPSSWSDWDGDRRYGLKISGGFGIDLWPAYPSDFRHRMTLELNTHGHLDDQASWGSRFSYSHPLNLRKRFFSTLSFHQYDDWQGARFGFIKYLGQQTFLIQGSRLNYQRVSLIYEHDKYGDPDVWDRNQEIDLVRGSYTGLSLTRFGNRIYLRLRAARGVGPDGGFNIVKSQVDLSGVVMDWLVGGLHFVGGSQSYSTPGPYQFTHAYAWQDELSALPNFRGQTTLDKITNNYLGLSLSGGYWLSWVQVKLFSSGMIYDDGSGPFLGIDPRYAAGFGFEHKSIFTAGLYFPVWQSMPDDGEPQWKWRYQWRFTWNL